jgi:ketosteroid isomerase-like protein
MIGALLAKRSILRGFEAMNRHDLPRFMAAWCDDASFIYPGDVPASGTFAGKAAVERWFRSFFEQFPHIRFDVRDVCVGNVFDMIGTNVVAARWDLELKNRAGRAGRNNGVTVIEIHRGRVYRVQDFIFDLGESFRLNWGVTQVPEAKQAATSGTSA